MSDTRVSVVLNGVDLTTVTNLAARMDADPGYAKDMSQFSRSVRVRWLDGFHSQAYTRDVPPHGYDEPEWLGGKNRAMAARATVSLSAVSYLLLNTWDMNATSGRRSANESSKMSIARNRASGNAFRLASRNGSTMSMPV